MVLKRTRRDPIVGGIGRAGAERSSSRTRIPIHHFSTERLSTWQVLETATLMVVVVTTLVGGAATGPMLEMLGLTQPPTGPAEENESLHPPDDVQSAPAPCR